MKIIGNNKAREWKFDLPCEGTCGSLLEVTEGDIVKKDKHSFIYGFVCPNCGCFTEVNKIIIPQYIKVKAPCMFN